MAIPNLKTKLKQNLKKDIEREKEGGGGRKDLRFLNYYDLKFGEKMTVLFVPDVNGSFWRKFSKHGPNLKITGIDGKDKNVRVDSISCARIGSGEDCAVCQKGFDLFALAKETADKTYKDEGKKWMCRDYTLVSCIVLESPMDIVTAEDGNQVKLMYLPFGIENVIKEAISEEIVDEADLCSTPFVIKKTKNQGGKASYDNSYFARKQVEDEELDFLSDMVVEQFDYEEIDIVPTNTTAEEMEDWLVIAEEAYEKAQAAVNRSSEKNSSTVSTVSTQQNRLASLGSKRKIQEESEEEEAQQEESPSVEEAVEESANSGESTESGESKSDSRADALSRLKKLRRG